MRMHCSRLLLALSLLTVVTGCGTSGGGDVQVIDLLELLPPNRSVEYKEPSAPVLKWSFAKGLPQGWTVGPEGVEIIQRPGGILLVSDESPPWVEARVTVDPYLYYSLQAVVRPRTRQPLTLFYAFDDPPFFHPRNRIKVTGDPKKNRQTLRFALPGVGSVERPMKALRIYPGTGGGTAVLQQLILQPRRGNYLERNILSNRRIALGQDYRDCWRITGTDSRTVTIRLPEEDAWLSFSLGTLRGPGQAMATVELARGEDSPEILFRQPFPPPLAPWEEARVDLAPWRGEEITLRFSTGDNGPLPVRLVGSPMIRTATRTRRPSVLLIVLDAQRADRFSLYGHHRLTSPHLARLAEEGILFSSATAACSWTVPSVAATFTGRHPDREQLARGHGGGLPRAATTLAQRFSGSGYVTGGFSANMLLTVNSGFSRGFDAWYAAPGKDIHPTARRLNRRALRWMRAHRDQETFCYIHYMDPHAPYDAPWPEPPVNPEPGGGGLGDSRGWQKGNLWPLAIGGEQIGPAGVRQVSRLYERGGEYTDFQIGALLAALRREGLLENTAVLVTADHGEELHDHGYWSHGSTLYQEVLHIPMILRLPEPGPEAGTVVHTPVALVDVAPTLAVIAGLPEVDGWSDGRDMHRLPPERILFSFSTAHAPLRFSIIKPPWKYIYFNRAAFDDGQPKTAQGRWLKDHGQPTELLFNLVEDPGERHNLIGERPEVEAEMRRRMEAWFAEAGSDLLVSAPEDAEAIDEEELEQLRALGYVQ